MPISGKAMVKLYEKHGWKHIRTSGSHWIMSKSGEGIVPIPVHGNRSLGKGLEAKLLRKVKN